MSNIARKSFAITGFTLLLLGISALTGCVSSNSSIHYLPQDPAVGKSGLNAVKVEKTTKDELTSIFGAPSGQTKSDDGTEILSYKYGKKKEGTFDVWPFVCLHDDKEELLTIYFEVTDGVVTKYWKEP